MSSRQDHDGEVELPAPVRVLIGRQAFDVHFAASSTGSPTDLIFTPYRPPSRHPSSSSISSSTVSSSTVSSSTVSSSTVSSSTVSSSSISSSSISLVPSKRLPLEDVLWLRSGQQSSRSGGGHECYPLVLHTFPVSGSSSAAVPKRRRADVALQFLEQRQRDDWLATAQRLLAASSWGRAERPTLPVLLLVNPFGGKGEAPAILQRVRVVFELAQLAVHVVETTRAGHAFDFVRTEPLLDVWSAVVTISGDGLLYEVVNGIMQRPDWRAVLDRLPVGVIPGGSGNGLAAALRNGDPTTAAYCIAKGWDRPLDLIRTLQSGRHSWSFLSVNWAMISDIDFESEAYRWMGGARFTVAAVARVLNLRTYSGRIQFQCAAAYPDPIVTPKPPSFFDNLFAADDDAPPPTTPPVCSVACAVCCSRQRRPVLSSSHDNDDDNDDEPAWSHDLQGKFVLVNAMNVSHISYDALIAPYAHLADGCMDLILIRKGAANKLELAAWLIGMEDGSHLAGCTIQEYYKITRLRLTPDDQRPGRIGIDGEHTPNTAIDCRLLPAALRLLGAR